MGKVAVLRAVVGEATPEAYLESLVSQDPTLDGCLDAHFIIHQGRVPDSFLRAPSQPRSRSPDLVRQTCVVCHEEVPLPAGCDQNGPDCCSSSGFLACFGPDGDQERHVTCKSCVQGWITAEMAANHLEFRCPEWDCGKTLRQEEIVPLLMTEQIQRMDKMTSSRAIDRDPLACWCPNSFCGRPVFRKHDREQRLCCRSCGTIFCSSCAGRWTLFHRFRCPGESAPVKRWAWSRTSLLTNRSRRCPTCSTRIEKAGGCNHITCWNCHTEWCWLCGKEYQPGHYSDPINGCPGMQNSELNLWGNSPPVRWATKTVGGTVLLGAGAVTIGFGITLAVLGAIAVAPIYGARRLHQIAGTCGDRDHEDQCIAMSREAFGRGRHQERSRRRRHFEAGLAREARASEFVAAPSSYSSTAHFFQLAVAETGASA